MCQIDDDDISLGLDPEYSSYELDNVSVEIFDATGASERHDYGRLALSSITPLVINDPGLREIDSTGQSPVRAVVTMIFLIRDATGQVIDTLTASNPIPVNP
ncbi:hypothetical protein ACNOYE_32280 [Nannocystaceae bacterium ST9]